MFILVLNVENTLLLAACK